VNIDKSSDIPVYIQICDSIAQDIIKGYRAAGEKLPPRRTLSKSLGVSQSTVDTAYQRLISEGYITSRTGSGYYVSDDRVWEDVASGAGSIRYNFSINGVETSKLPFAEWARLTRSTIKEGKSLFQHGAKEGEWQLRKSIRRLLLRTRGIRCRTEQIIIGPGADDLMRELFMLLARDSTLIMNGCCNLRAVEAASSAGIKTIHLKNDFDGLETKQLEAFESGVLFQMPVHDLPTGASLTEERLNDIVNWSGTDRYVIEDGNGYTYTQSGAHKTLWERMGGKNVIYLDTFSRTVAPSMKIAYFVADEEIIARLFRMRRFFSCRVSRIEQVTLSKFIDLGHYERHIGYMGRVYKEKMLTLKRAFLSSPLGDRVQFYGDDTGLFCTVHFDIETPEEKAAGLLEQNGIKVRRMTQDLAPGAKTDIPQNTYTAGFGELTASQIREAVRHWCRAWDSIS